jgi:hypothetical protein
VCDATQPYRFEALGSAIASDDPAVPIGSGCHVRIEHRTLNLCRAVVECDGAPVYDDDDVACRDDERESVDSEGETSSHYVLVAEGKRGFSLDEGSGIATASSDPPASARIVLHRWEEEGDL